MTRTVFDTAMTAHIWAQGRQAEGRNSARRVFFEGPFLYSYGYHYLSGYLCPDGAAFLNSDRRSVSTARHNSNARRATRGRAFLVPDLAALASILDSSLFRRPVWVNREGALLDSPYDSAGNHIALGRAKATFREATAKEAKAARPLILAHFMKAEETAPAESIAAALEYAGAKPEEARKAAARVLLAHKKRAAAAKAEEVKAAKYKAASDARAAAARPLSDYAARVQEARDSLKARNSYRGAAEEQAGLLLDTAKRLFRARKEAKAKGWTRLCADLLAREKLLREGAAGLGPYAAKLARLSFWQGNKKEMREGLAALRPGGPAITGGYAWQLKREAAGALLKLVKAAALDESHWLASRAKLAGASLPRMAEGLAAHIEALSGAENRAYAGQARATILKEVKALKAWKVAGPAAPLKIAEEAARVASRYGLVTYGANTEAESRLAGARKIPDYRPSLPAAYALAGFTGEAFAKIRKEAQERAAAARLEEAAAKLEAWRAGGRESCRLTDPKGGALLRALDVERDESGAIVSGLLSTSQGATVPLTHALKAFRFLKLCREAGKPWAANGKSLAVGHFRIDRIDSQGNFRAGCHYINWPEVSALAARLGVASLAPEDTTENKA